MSKADDTKWKHLIVSPLKVLDHIEPGVNIYLGSGVAEPRTLMKCLMDSNVSDVKDLELIQLNSNGDILSLQKLDCQNSRLKTFFCGRKKLSQKPATPKTIKLRCNRRRQGRRYYNPVFSFGIVHSELGGL